MQTKYTKMWANACKNGDIVVILPTEIKKIATMKHIFTTFTFAAMALAATAQNINVIPQPAYVSMGKGVCANADRACIVEDIDAAMLHPDGYALEITKKKIFIKAQSKAGLQYAHETLAQLRTQYGSQIPAMSIVDYPRYEWRGLMLDCSRHFYTLEYLKKQVDILAHYKMNRLHLHLTDDQGWRIEIKRYPELTQQGAWREFNEQDSICLREYKDRPEFELDPRFIVHHGPSTGSGQAVTLYGGYYTQEELRDLVAYAEERNVTIVPEIDMPGHTQAISALYPEFTATGEAKWGTVFSYPLSPAKEEVYTFLQNVLDEVMDIFPSKYIHIGADEVEKDTWKKSEACQALMKREGFETYEALQSYFVNRMHKYIQSKGREMICWDDAIEGGDFKAPGAKGALPESADIMYWRYWVGGVTQRVLEQGHHIIFTPGSPMYVAAEGPMYNIYHYDGFDKVPAEFQHLVRGGQVSLWAESMSNFRRADVCIYPRLLALSERLWTPAEEMSWKSFKQRLDEEKKWLDAHDVRYAKTFATLNAMQQTDLEGQQMKVVFDSEFSEPDIRYTLDGSVPTMQSPRYTDVPICVTDPVNMVAAIMIDGKPQEPMFRRELEYHKAVGAKVEYTTRRWHESYKAAEVATFTDGKRGSLTGFGDGLWQGFTGSFEVVVDLGKADELHLFTMRFLQDIGPGVFMPGQVEVQMSEDGKDYTSPRYICSSTPADQKGIFIEDFTADLGATRARYIKVNVRNTNGGFVFADEIVVK